MPKTSAPPTFSIVSPETTSGSPPRDLGRHGRKLWDEIQAAYAIDDRGGCELLAQCCAALDRAEALAAAIATDGAIIYTRTGVPKSHPGCKDELNCRAFIVRTLEQLGLNVEAVRPGPGDRPPTLAGQVRLERHQTHAARPVAGDADHRRGRPLVRRDGAGHPRSQAGDRLHHQRVWPVQDRQVRRLPTLVGRPQ